MARTFEPSTTMRDRVSVPTPAAFSACWSASSMSGGASSAPKRSSHCRANGSSRRAPDVEELLGGRALAEDDRQRLVVGAERERGGAVAAAQLARPARRADHDVAHRHQRAASGGGEIGAGEQRRHPGAGRAAHRDGADGAGKIERGMERRGVELLGVAGRSGREQQAIEHRPDGCDRRAPPRRAPRAPLPPPSTPSSRRSSPSRARRRRRAPCG